MNEVLTRIQTLMDERNWTLYRLSQESGIPYSSLSSLFKKDNHPTISTLEKICAGFHITLSEFFSDRPPYRDSSKDYTEDEKILVDKYRRLSRKNQSLLSAIANLLADSD